MKDFTIALYNPAKSGFPVKIKRIRFETLADAENYCARLTKKLKTDSCWKVSQIGGI